MTAPARSAQPRPRPRRRTTKGLRIVTFQFFDVSDQFVLFRPALKVKTNHLVRPERRLPARPKTDQQAGDDRHVRLYLYADLILA